MIVIVNKIIPFPGFQAINLFGVIFARKDEWEKASGWQKSVWLSHEDIHNYQQRELLWVFFYIAYFFEWLFLLIKYRDSLKAYENISFEKEAYRYQLDFQYVNNRKHYAQWRK